MPRQAKPFELSDLVPIPGLAGYFVTRDGRVFSHRQRNLRELKQSPIQQYVRVKADGKWRKVHQLMCLTFHGPRPEGHEACHNNGKHRDNRADNVRWDTHQANMADARRHGTLYRFQAHEHFGSRKLTEAQVVEIRIKLAAGLQSLRSIATEFKVDAATVMNIRDGRTWKNVGTIPEAA